MDFLKKSIKNIFSSDLDKKNIHKHSIYDIKINSLQGKSIHFSDFKGKHILFVNVASKCGFTPQYKELQKLHDTFKNKLVVIGVPCNQFGSQEPGTAFEIQEFCEVNYGVDFLITEKIDVKGNAQHPLYKWLTDKNINGFNNSNVKWNFQKYLVNPKGNLVDYFYSTTKPLSKKITKYL
ncbi:glutathione peroxidase [Flavobacteriaceae bacterium S0825]|uniref:glutathione peroxidase n=1 Tax=Gaetbulibacter sp. S0825 TaxID=2720084 RepID=UPI001430C1D2|nr:glutathione peroxidase [Gaetbulibacter sp. S0825]MCK0109396.1 glutathione peroxidase [Flavobacteriaceae bacterium S0825]NIX65030.1 glutathione peroxidase [Gaetbulibacter sp. S0825]